MKKFLLTPLFALYIISLHAQQYSAVGGLETTFKNTYHFKATLNEKIKTLSFETDAPVSVVTLETFTPEEIITRKGKEYTNMYYVKKGNTYTFNLTKAQLKDKTAYWLKVSTGNNGVPLAEYYFKRKAIATVEVPTINDGEEIKGANDATIIKTNIKCAAGKTKVMAALKVLDGVFDVKIDIANGKLSIKYSSDGTPYRDILSTINENGFDADGQKTSNATLNVCKPKTSN